ncbi:MAG: hypothetical protein QMB94_14945 [Phycisphaerales bacterium]
MTRLAPPGSREIPDQPLPTPKLSAEFTSRGGHWYCHHNGSAAKKVRVGAALAVVFPEAWREGPPDGPVQWWSPPYRR